MWYTLLQYSWVLVVEVCTWECALECFCLSCALIGCSIPFWFELSHSTSDSELCLEWVFWCNIFFTNLLLMVVFIYYALLLWPFLLIYRWPHLLQRRRLLLRKLTKGWKWTITYLGWFNTLRDIESLSLGEPSFKKGLLT